MSILNHLFNKQRDKEKHDALLARDEALRAAGAGMEQPSRQEALLSLFADQEDKQAATSAMEAKLNQQQLGGSGGPIAAPAPVADIQGGGIYGAQRPQPSMQTSLVNQLLRRAFVGDEADGAMKWFDRDRYYAKKEAEAKSALSAREGAMQEQARQQAEEQAGANWRQIGADRMIPGGSVLNNRSVARLLQQMGGPTKANEVLANVRYAKEMQDALASKAYKDGVLNVPNNTLAFSRFGGPSVRGGMTVKEMVPDPTTGMLVERERYVPESVSAMDVQGSQGSSRYGINLFDGFPATDPPNEAALNNAGAAQPQSQGGGMTAKGVGLLNDVQTQAQELLSLAEQAPTGTGLPGWLGAATSNIDPVGFMNHYSNKLMNIDVGQKLIDVGNAASSLSPVGDATAEGGIASKWADVIMPAFYPTKPDDEKNIMQMQNTLRLKKERNAASKK